MRRDRETELGDDLTRGKVRVIRKTFRFDWVSLPTLIRDWFHRRKPYVRKFDAPNPERRTR